MLLLYSCLMGAVYIVNQIFDVETDRLNRKLFLVAEGYVDRTAVWVEAGLLFGGAITLAFNRYPPAVGLLMAASGALGLLYSVPPFKFKARPFLDVLANGFGYGMLAFATGWAAAGKYSDAVWLASAPYVLAVAAVYLNTTIPDYASDKATGNVTTGVFLGGRATTWLALFLMAVALALALGVGDALCAVAAGCSLPLFIMAAVSGRMRWVMLSYQAGALTLVALVGMVFPLYFGLLVATFLALKFYHRWRFGMDYPRFADRA
jgi:4-hydroxybenzoate polyprenyltransferase